MTPTDGFVVLGIAMFTSMLSEGSCGVLIRMPVIICCCNRDELTYSLLWFYIIHPLSSIFALTCFHCVSLFIVCMNVWRHLVAVVVSHWCFHLTLFCSYVRDWMCACKLWICACKLIVQASRGCCCIALMTSTHVMSFLCALDWMCACKLWICACKLIV